MSFNPPVAEAIEEIRLAFPTCVVTATPDAGGAWVVIDGLDLGSAWNEGPHTIAFHIAPTCPYADVYPHFLDVSARLTNGKLPGHVTADATYHLDRRPGLQVSRRSNRWNPALDTPANKTAKVIAWLRAA